MKVLFLDFDGVINSDDWIRNRRRPEKFSETREMWERNAFDREAVQRVNRILAATQAKVVISSSWRLTRRLHGLRALLAVHGFIGEIIGRTPVLTNCQRGDEIHFWLNKNPVESFVVLDDADDMDAVRDHLVQTSWAYGLLDEHVEQVIAMLNDRASSNRLG